MALVIPRSAEIIILGLILNKVKPEDLVLRLYVNDETPTKKSVLKDFTEADNFGYDGITLSPGRWGIEPGDPTQASYATQVFTFTGKLGQVFGYFITRETSGHLVLAERFGDGPYNIINNGDKIEVTLNLSSGE